LRAHDPKNLEVAFLLGETSLRLHQPATAVENYQAATASPELKGAALQGAGLALLQLGRLDEAAASLEQTTATDTSLWRSYSALGRIYDSRHDWPKADGAYRAALAANPNDASLLNNIGMSYLLQRRFDDAIGEFEKAVRLDPTLAVARANMRIAFAL